MRSQYFALDQLVDLSDLVDPVMPDDWDKYFPDDVRNYYCMSLSHDRATDWAMWNLTTLLREKSYKSFFVDEEWEHFPMEKKTKFNNINPT